MVISRQSLVRWGEAYLFKKGSPFQRLLAYLLLPLSGIYCLIIFIKKRKRNTYRPAIPVISIGNLTVGGSGKTPATINLAARYEKSAVLLRGYGRESQGLVVVKTWDSVQTDVRTSGDEAMLYAKSLPDSMVIVSEDRVAGIEEAVRQGAKILFLDDGHSKYAIQKLDVLIRPYPEPVRRFCLPSGAYREAYSAYGEADFILDEASGLTRNVTLDYPSEKMLLITAIAKPERLDPFLPHVLGKVYFEDHHFFTEEEVRSLMARHRADTILCTGKDAVKLESFGLPLCTMQLSVSLDPALVRRIDAYLAAY